SPLSSPMFAVPSTQAPVNAASGIVQNPVAQQSNPITPVSNTPNDPSSGNAGQHTPVLPAQPQSSFPPTEKLHPTESKQRKRWLVALIAALIIILLVSSFAGLYRSEERRVGKECISGWWCYHIYKKDD